MIDPGPFEHGAEDFRRHIAHFREAGVEILYAPFDALEWRGFWTQAQHLDFRPRIETVSKALFREVDAAAFGGEVDGKSTDIWWSPQLPLRSALTDATAAELADRYHRETGRPWCQQLGVVHSLWEAGFAALAPAPIRTIH